MMMVDRQLGRLNSLFRLVQGKNLTMDTFEERLTFQKTIYLLNSIGIVGLPHQTWYVKGPYSQNLTTSGFLIHEQKEKPSAEILPSEIEKISKLKDAFSSEMSNFDQIELLVSAVYVFKERQIFDIENAAEWISNKKPWYELEDIKHMLHKVQENRELFNF